MRLDMNAAALVLIDLQQGTLDLPLMPITGDEVARTAATLADEFRRAGRPVFYVRVDLRDLQHGIVERPLFDVSQPVPPEAASEIAASAGRQDTDVLVTKRHWGAFQSTELDLLLRRRAVRTVVLAGVATNFGVESTARMAFDLGYNVVFVTDAIAGVDADAHRFAMEGIFPFMGRTASSAEITASLAG